MQVNGCIVTGREALKCRECGVDCMVVFESYDHVRIDQIRLGGHATVSFGDKAGCIGRIAEE